VVGSRFDAYSREYPGIAGLLRRSAAPLAPQAPRCTTVNITTGALFSHENSAGGPLDVFFPPPGGDAREATASLE
jgi:hypothetical protein